MVFPESILGNPMFQFFVSLPVYLLGLFYFGKSAFGSIKNGMPNMDVLIFTGALSSWAYSIIGTFVLTSNHHSHEYLFFETGASIITLVLLGNKIEQLSVKKTTKDLDILQSLQIKKAKKILEHENHLHIQEVETITLKKDDCILCLSGEAIATDGIIILGEAEIDESMITGESIPIYKKVGDNVLSGSIIINGNIRVLCTKAQSDSTIASIIQMIKNATAQRPSIQKIGDQISAVFVPIVIIISIITFILNYWFFQITFTDSIMRAIAVLVISCPCAMGLATPTAIMAGVGRAARLGILVKSALSLETLAKVKYILLDKTGTLTNGEFEIESFDCFDKSNESKWKNIIYHMEMHSNHPIAKSVVKMYKDWKQENIQFKYIEEVKGMGLIGAIEFIGEIKVISSTEYPYDFILLCNDELKCGINIKDKLKVGFETMNQYFKENKIEPIILSGDKSKKVKSCAEAMSIKEYYSDLKPKQKLDMIDSYNGKGITVMVGDGINDSPSLKKAMCGISFSHASDVAQNVSDVILLKNDLNNLINAIETAKLTYLTIRQNLWWALGYNLIAIPLAACGLMHPMLAASSMAFSDVIVIGNSLRLRYKISKKQKI